MEPLVFNRIATKKKSAQVAEQVLDRIRRGTYKVGDRLPPERVLAEQMGVSRPSVREALSALELAGIVESRSGDGTYVARSVPDRLDEIAALTILEESSSILEALEARRVFERGIVSLAISRVTDQALMPVRAAASDMDQAAADRDYDRFNGANHRFHLAIAAMSGNPVLQATLQPLLAVMRERLALALRRKAYQHHQDYFSRTLRAHKEILAALEAADEAAVLRAIETHFDLLESSVKED